MKSKEVIESLNMLVVAVSNQSVQTNTKVKNEFSGEMGCEIGKLIRLDQEFRIEHAGKLIQYCTGKYWGSEGNDSVRKALKSFVDVVEKECGGIVHFPLPDSNMTKNCNDEVASFLEKIKELDIQNVDSLQDVEGLLARYQMVGITNCMERLDSSSFNPEICMSGALKSIRFMGVAGSKWILGDDEEKTCQLKRLFQGMINQTKIAGKYVKFLLLSPFGTGWDELNQLREGSLRVTSYIKFLELMNSENKTNPKDTGGKDLNFEVRLFDELPHFRLQFIDDKYVTVSRYVFSINDPSDREHGFDAPHLFVHKEEDGKYPYSFYEAFEKMFIAKWDDATKLIDKESELEDASKKEASKDEIKKGDTNEG